jgi:hypothetical protein
VRAVRRRLTLPALCAVAAEARAVRSAAQCCSTLFCERDACRQLLRGALGRVRGYAKGGA